MRREACFDVVTQFEEALCEYTGSTFAVTVDSCTNALALCFHWLRLNDDTTTVVLPKHTYVGVLQAARNAGFKVKFRDLEWKGAYPIDPLPLVDSAKHFERDMATNQTFTCVSFQAGKILPIGRGGAILHADSEADQWLRKARLDGRTAGVDYADNTYQGRGWHAYMTPPDAARGLWLLTYADDDDQGDWTEYPDLSEARWR